MSKSQSKRNKKQKQENHHQHHQHPEHHEPPPANAPSPTPSTPAAVTDFRPVGNRKSKGSDDASIAETPSAPKSTTVPPTGDMMLPGVTPGQDEKTSLKIKVHLNLHAKVRIDVDAQLYGDIIIGLL